MMLLWTLLLLSPSLSDLWAAAFRTDLPSPESALGTRGLTKTRDVAEGKSPACPEARPTASRHRFELDSKDLGDFSLWQDWVLKSSETCEGPDFGTASLMPVVNASMPEASKVAVHINETGSADETATKASGALRLFVCDRAGQCATSLGFRARAGARISDILYFVAPVEIARGIRNLSPSMLLFIDALLILALVCLLGLVVWFALRLRDSRADGRWGLTSEEDVSDPNLRLPSSMDVLLQGGIDVLFFVIGCALFVIEGERFFRKQYHQDMYMQDESQDRAGFLFVLVFPLLFGSVAVLRIFMATARCQLFYASLRDGILLKFQQKPSYFEPMLLWFWLGLAICIGKASQIMLLSSSDFGQGFKALVVLLSPLYYMTSSILDILHTEMAVCNQHCTISLKASEDESICVGGNMACMSDSAFCRLARSRQEITLERRNADEGEASEGFGALDLAWIGRLLSQRASGAKKLVLLLFDPMQAMTFLCLALLTCWVGLKILLHQPQLTELQVIGGALSSPFVKHISDYNILVDRMQTMVSVSAQADPKDVTELSMRDSSEQGSLWTWGGSIAKAVTIDKDHYPYNINIEVWDTTAHNSYDVQILKSGFLPESISITGRGPSGKIFHRCIPWGYLWNRPWIYVPVEVASVDVKISVAHFVMGVPQNRREANGFTTHFLPNSTEKECDQLLFHMPFSAVAQFTKAGCFAVYQPLWENCGRAGQDEASHFLGLRSSTISAEICREAEHDCRTVETNSPELHFDNFSVATHAELVQSCSVKMSVKTGNTILPIVDATNFYRVNDLRIIPGHPPASHVLQFFVTSPRLQTSAVEYAKHVGRWFATIYDNEAFKTEKFLPITAVSQEIDCVVESMQVRSSQAGTQVLKVSDQHDVSLCPYYPLMEGCDNGYNPARTFFLDLDFMRNAMIMQGVYGEGNHLIHLAGRMRCQSFRGFYGEEDMVLFDLQHVTQVSLDVLVHDANGSVRSFDASCRNTNHHSQFCVVYAEGPGLGHPSQTHDVNLTLIFNQPNCTVSWKKTWDSAYPQLVDLTSTQFPHIKLDPRECDRHYLLQGAEACNGTRPSWTTMVELAHANFNIPNAAPVSVTQVQGYLHCNTFIDAILEVSITASSHFPEDQSGGAGPYGPIPADPGKLVADPRHTV